MPVGTTNIDALEVAVELGISHVNWDMNDPAVRALAERSSGQISFSDFAGKSAGFQVTIGHNIISAPADIVGYAAASTLGSITGMPITVIGGTGIIDQLSTGRSISNAINTISLSFTAAIPSASPLTLTYNGSTTVTLTTVTRVDWSLNNTAAATAFYNYLYSRIGQTVTMQIDQ